MNILGIIPARYQSSRFPGKPLALIGEKTMIQQVYEQASKSKHLSKVVVATDDTRIAVEVKTFGGEVFLTSSDHINGTSRCYEVYEEINRQHPDFYGGIVNIQGDEPYIDPDQIDMLCKLLKEQNAEIATLAKVINTEEELFNPNVVKLVFNKNNEVVYFSRNPIPFVRNYDKKEWIKKHTFYKHIGIYGFKTAIFDEINKLKASELELAESLEQLKWLENDYKIKVDITEIESFGIDTPEDLQKLINNI